MLPQGAAYLPSTCIYVYIFIRLWVLTTTVRGVGKIAKELGVDFAEAVVGDLHLGLPYISYYNVRLGSNLERDAPIPSSKGS